MRTRTIVVVVGSAQDCVIYTNGVWTRIALTASNWIRLSSWLLFLATAIKQLVPLHTTNNNSKNTHSHIFTTYLYVYMRALELPTSAMVFQQSPPLSWCYGWLVAAAVAHHACHQEHKHHHACFINSNECFKWRSVASHFHANASGGRC